MFIKKLFAFAFIFSLLGFFPRVTLADDYGLGKAMASSGLPTSINTQSTLPGVAGVVVNSALSLIGVFFFILMVYAGFTWMKSMGSSEDVEKSKEIIQTAIIGLVIVSAAYAISNFIFTKLNAGI